MDADERNAPRIHDDDENERDGIHLSYDEEDEAAAQRRDLADQLEELLEDAYRWQENTDDDDAQEIINLLAEALERLDDTGDEDF
jgi:hypothetical protein